MAKSKALVQKRQLSRVLQCFAWFCQPQKEACLKQVLTLFTIFSSVAQQAELGKSMAHQVWKRSAGLSSDSRRPAASSKVVSSLKGSKSK